LRARLGKWHPRLTTAAAVRQILIAGSIDREDAAMNDAQPSSFCREREFVGNPRFVDEEAGSEPSEADLLHRARRGDAGAWRELIERYTRLVRSRARACGLQEADVQDVAQNTWLRLAENLARIRTPEALAGWVSTVAARDAARIARRRARERPVDEMADSVHDSAPDPQEQVLCWSEQDRVRAAVATLEPHRQALIRELFASDRAPYATIAERLGMPVGSLGPTRARTLVQLRRHLLATG
jgi:RNA polymerase sigma factor (sigma-70 family)